MSRPVVALCTWEDFNYEGRVARLSGCDGSVWLPRDEPPTACRASLGERFLTVWLPRGAVTRYRIARYRWTADGSPPDPMTDEYAHVYGSHGRMTRTRIRITLTEYPHA